MNMKTIIYSASIATLFITAVSTQAIAQPIYPQGIGANHHDMTINSLVMPLRIEDVVNYQNIYEATGMENQNGTIVLVTEEKVNDVQMTAR